VLGGPALAVGSMLLFAGYTIGYKRHYDGLPALLYLGLVEGSAFCWYVLLGGLTGQGIPLPGSAAVAPRELALFGFVVAATVASAYAAVRALQVGEASYVTPLSRLAPPVVLALEVALVGASLGARQVAGLAAVTLGVYVLNYDGGRPLAPFRRVARSRPARLALASAVLVGAADVGRRVLLSSVAVAPRTLVAVTLAGLAGGTLPFGLRWWHRRPRRPLAWAGLAALGLALAAGDHLAALALARTSASVVVPIISAQAVVVALVGGELLGERATGRRTLAAAVTAVGVVLVATG